MTLPRLSRLFSLFLCGALVLTLAACDSNDDDGNDFEPGTATVEITGDSLNRSLNLDLNASFGETQTGDGPIFFVDMAAPDDSSARVTLTRYLSGRPAPGDYLVIPQAVDSLDEAFTLAGSVIDTAQLNPVVEVFAADTGMVSITSSSGDRVEGNFDADGIFTDSLGTQIDVNVSGSFEAPQSF